MTLDEMRAFVRVVEQGSFTKAALASGTHTSKISGLIRNLEQGLNTQLLVRSTRSVRVTLAGQEILNRVRNVLASVDELVAASRQDNKTAEGHLRISLASDYGLLRGFAAAYPKVRLSIHHETAKVDLVRDDFDLALRQGPLKDSTLKAQRLGDVDFGLFAAPEYLARRGAPTHPAEFTRHDWLRLDLKPRRPIRFRWQGQMVEADPEPRFMFSDVAGLRDGALQGLGIARLAVLVAAPWLELGRLSVVMPLAAFEPSPLYAVHSSTGRSSPLLRAFTDYARQAMGTRASSGGPE